MYLYKILKTKGKEGNAMETMQLIKKLLVLGLLILHSHWTTSEAQVHHDSLNSNRKLIRVVHQQDLINKVALGDRKLYPPPPPQGSQKTAF